jgi:hypothetical protein
MQLPAIDLNQNKSIKPIIPKTKIMTMNTSGPIKATTEGN